MTYSSAYVCSVSPIIFKVMKYWLRTMDVEEKVQIIIRYSNMKYFKSRITSVSIFT